jgi:hypothetical protein
MSLNELLQEKREDILRIAAKREMESLSSRTESYHHPFCLQILLHLTHTELSEMKD